MRLFFLVCFLIPFSCFTQIQIDSLGSDRVITQIIIIGNDKTKPEIIHRELAFSIGDIVSDSSLEYLTTQARQNLLNTSLFTIVNVQINRLNQNQVDFLIILKERWYTWVVPLVEYKETNFNNWIKEGNFSRTNIGANIIQRNFRGRNEILGLDFKFGYAPEFGIKYIIPYINKNLNTGLTLASKYYTQEELNYNSFDNKRALVKLEDKHIINAFSIEAALKHRHLLNNYFTLKVGFNNVNFNDTLIQLNANLAPSKHFQYVSIFGQYAYDKRDIKPYPLKGYYLKSILQSDWDVLNFNNSQLYLRQDIKQYLPIKNRWYFAHSLKMKYTFVNPPYFLQHGLGYKEFLRAYEYYVIDGQHYGLYRSNIKYNLVKEKNHHFDFVRPKNFQDFHYSIYVNYFLDGGYVYNNSVESNFNNSFQNNFLLSHGIGIDFVTYYDKIFRFELSMNREKETGVFIHFIQPI